MDSRSPQTPRRALAALTIAAAGIVFGAIGTSPLYALDQLYFGHGAMPLSRDNVLGGISLVIWALTIIVAVKYAVFVLRAHNDGEGGVFALYGLLHGHKNRGVAFFLWSLVLGAGLLFGDGVITPAISVLSVVEGLGVAAPSLSRLVIPITVVLLTGLFALQARGTTGFGESSARFSSAGSSQSRFSAPRKSDATRKSWRPSTLYMVSDSLNAPAPTMRC